MYIYTSFKNDSSRNGDVGSSNAYNIYISAVHLGSAVDTRTQNSQPPFVVERFRDAKR